MPPADEQTEQTIEILAECAASIQKFAEVFLSGDDGRFSRPFSARHSQLFEAYDDPSIQKILVLAHRGFGKTSIFNYLVPLHAIVFQKYKFIVPASCSSTNAIMQSDNLRREIIANPMLRAVIGDIKPVRGQEDAAKFSSVMWDTSNGCRILPRGMGQQVRGILYNNARMQLGICDDLEDAESVLSREQRDKTKRWFFSDFSNAVDRSQNNWRLIVVGTILHESALLNDLKDDPSWTTLEFPLCDENFKSYWPAFMGDPEVKALHKNYKDQGIVEEFYLEYMNIANPKEDAVFRPEFFKYYSEGDLNFDSDQYDHIILVDPAKTEKVHNAYSAIVGVSIDTSTNKIYVRDVVNEHLTPDDIYKKTFDMAQRINAKVIGYEVTGLSEFIVQPMKNEMLRRGLVYELVELKARKGEGDFATKGTSKGKASRIGALAPYYRMGMVYHNDSGVCSVLESQLMAYPRAKFWDAMDALAYVVEMMELGERYMEQDDADSPLYRERQRSLDERYQKLMDEDDDPLDWDSDPWDIE